MKIFIEELDNEFFIDIVVSADEAHHIAQGDTIGMHEKFNEKIFTYCIRRAKSDEKV